MNSVVKAVLVGAVAGAFHMFIMLAKDVSNYSIAAIVIQYIIASVVIFHVPLKITGWKKGLAVAVFSALPILSSSLLARSMHIRLTGHYHRWVQRRNISGAC